MDAEIFESHQSFIDKQIKMTMDIDTIRQSITRNSIKESLKSVSKINDDGETIISPLDATTSNIFLYDDVKFTTLNDKDNIISQK